MTGCGAGALASVQSGHERWLEVVTPHFVLSTNQLSAQALDTARALEEVRASLLTLAWTGAREPPQGRVDVVVFRRPSDFDRYSGLRAATTGVAFGRPGSPRLLSFSPGANNGIPIVIVHELSHDLSAWFMPFQPPWFSEGLATYLETTRYDRSSHLAVMGATSESKLAWLRATRSLLSSQKLFAVKERTYDDVRETQSFYASAWFLVHYLLNGESIRFANFQRRLAHLEGWRDAWEEAFPGLSPEQLDQQLLAYAKEAAFVELSAPVPIDAFEPKQRVLSEAEMHGVLAELASMQQPELAGQELREALRLDPDELNALVLRFHALSHGDPARLEVAQRAVTAHPGKAEAWLLLAQAADAGVSEQALQHAYQLEPAHPGVALLMARQRMRLHDARGALPYTRLAIRRSPPSVELVELHLQALVAHHNCADARLLEQNAQLLFGMEAWGHEGRACGAAGALHVDDPKTCIDSVQMASAPAAATGTGRLPGELIRRIVRQHQASFRSCYEAGLARHPDLNGRVVTRFVIATDGKVSDVAIPSADLPDCRVIACIRNAFSELEFPPPKGGIVTVSYPLQLDPG
jgi:tetratricopeptide (TPR) repeat protein